MYSHRKCSYKKCDGNQINYCAISECPLAPHLYVGVGEGLLHNLESPIVLASSPPLPLPVNFQSSNCPHIDVIQYQSHCTNPSDKIQDVQVNWNFK